MTTSTPTAIADLFFGQFIAIKTAERNPTNLFSITMNAAASAISDRHSISAIVCLYLPGIAPCSYRTEASVDICCEQLGLTRVANSGSYSGRNHGLVARSFG